MMYEIKGEKRSRASVERIMEALREELPRNRGYVDRVTDSTIEFTSPYVQFNWNIFAPVSRGVVTVERRDGQSVLSYRISLFRVRVVATLFTVMAVAMAISSGELAVLFWFVPLAIFVGWGWGYGMNYLITTGRVSGFFDRLLKDLPAEPPPLLEQEQETANKMPGHVP
ncbi:MAG: hypothetical protein ACYSWQ_05060 [Planctomycetota bacterium]|jgi:hypothetical protein